MHDFLVFSRRNFNGVPLKFLVVLLITGVRPQLFWLIDLNTLNLLLFEYFAYLSSFIGSKSNQGACRCSIGILAGGP